MPEQPVRPSQAPRRLKRFNTRINERIEKIRKSPKTWVAAGIVVFVFAAYDRAWIPGLGGLAADPLVRVETTSSSETTGVSSVPLTLTPLPLPTSTLPQLTASPATTSSTTTTSSLPTDPCDLALEFEAPARELLDLDRFLVRWELGRAVLQASQCAYRFTHNDEWSLDRSLTGSIGGPGSGYTLIVEDELIISATFAIGAPDRETTTQRAVELLLALVIDDSTDGGLFESGFESRCTDARQEFWGASDVSESAVEVERCDESASPSL